MEGWVKVPELAVRANCTESHRPELVWEPGVAECCTQDSEFYFPDSSAKATFTRNAPPDEKNGISFPFVDYKQSNTT